MLARRLMGLTIALLACSSLVACEVGAGYGYASLRTSQNGLEVAICSAVDAKRLELGVRGNNTSADWVVTGAYVGAHSFSPGDIVRIGDPIDGMKLVKYVAVEPEDGQEYYLAVQGNGEFIVTWDPIVWADVGDN
jgi:hypothetical protein